MYSYTSNSNSSRSPRWPICCNEAIDFLCRFNNDSYSDTVS